MVAAVVLYLAYRHEWVLAAFVAVLGVKALSSSGRFLGWMMRS